MKKLNQIILRKPNEIIEVLNRPLSSVGYKAYNFILSKFQEQKSNHIVIPTSEILDNIGATNSYEEIYLHLDELQNTQVKSIDKRGKLWGGFVLLSAFKKIDEGLYLEIPQIIADRLFKDENLYYTTIKLLEEKSFKSSYSLIFYEIFKKYNKVELPIYTIEELRQMTRTVDKYKVFYEFKRNVLFPAIKEINAFDSKFVYDFEEIYLGKKINKIKFIKTLKELKEPQLSLPNNSSKTISSEKLLSAIEKVKKNIHIARKFSKRAVNNAVKQYGEEIVIAGLERMSTYNFPIEKFANFLTSTLSEVKKEKEVKRTPAPTIKKEEKVVPLTPAVPKEELSDLDKFKSKVLGQAHSQLSETDWQRLILEVYQAKTKDMVEVIIKKYDLEINLTLI